LLSDFDLLLVQKIPKLREQARLVVDFGRDKIIQLLFKICNCPLQFLNLGYV
jgi:hypothetical protein